jgi:GT2 family glycosyltransferase
MRPVVTDGMVLDISVSVVVYRDYQTPQAMIASLEEQSDAALRKTVVVVDNSSLNDSSPLMPAREAFISFLGRFDDVIYLDAQANLGFGAANNLALKQVDSKYHAFINPDILFTEDSLAKTVSVLENDPSVGMVIPRLVDAAGRLQPAYRREVTVLDALNRTVFANHLHMRHRRHVMQDMDYSQEFDVPFGQGSFLVARTGLLKDIGGFDERYFMYLEDADLCKRLRQVARLVYTPDTTVTHRWERGSHKDRRLMKAHLKSYAAYFRKWGVKIV